MKKTFCTSLLAITFSLTLATPILGAPPLPLPLYIDNTPIATEPYQTWGASGHINGQYFLDALPELKENRVYVPISTLSKFLGAVVSWQDPIITIYYNNTQLILTLGEQSALYDNKVITLDASPYISKGRTMVPLRFVSEVFGCFVAYNEGQINMTFPPFTINDTSIASVQKQYYMTMGNMIEENTSNLYMSRIYPIIESSKKTLVPAPERYGSTIHYISPDYYYEQVEYSFLDISGKPIGQYKLYYTLKDYETDSKTWMMHDVLADQWYSFCEENYSNLVDLENIGNWTVIYNGVP